MSHEDGSVLFSKLKEGRMPRLEEVLDALETKLKAGRGGRIVFMYLRRYFFTNPLPCQKVTL